MNPTSTLLPYLDGWVVRRGRGRRGSGSLPWRRRCTGNGARGLRGRPHGGGPELPGPSPEHRLAARSLRPFAVAALRRRPIRDGAALPFDTARRRHRAAARRGRARPGAGRAAPRCSSMPTTSPSRRCPMPDRRICCTPGCVRPDSPQSRSPAAAARPCWPRPGAEHRRDPIAAGRGRPAAQRPSTTASAGVGRRMATAAPASIVAAPATSRQPMLSPNTTAPATSATTGETKA